MQILMKRWPHNWVFFGACTVYLALATEPFLLYSCFGSLLPNVPACPTSLASVSSVLSQPAGLIFAITGFLSQCFVSSWLGALVIVLAALGLSELARCHFKRAGFSNLPGLTCAPVIMIILIYSQYQHPLLGVLVVCLGLLGAWILALVPRQKPRLALLVLCVTTVVTFWLGGTGALTVCLTMICIHALHGRKQGMALALGSPMSLAVIWLLLHYVALTDVAQAWPLTMPHAQAVTGGMKAFPKGLMIALYSCVPLCLGTLVLGRGAWHWRHHSPAKKPRKHKKAQAADQQKNRVLGLVQAVAISTLPFALMGLSLVFSHDPLSKPNVQMHHHSHLRQWNQVLKIAGQLPKGQTSVYVNHAVIRALGHMHRLPFDLLKYPQTQQGVFLTHETSVSALTQLKLHDLYLDLGQVNMAEKQVSELLAAGLDFGFIYERLAWIHIIKEQYDTARIFINALHKIPLYREAAQSLVRTLDHGLPEDQVKRVRRIRACMPTHADTVRESLDEMLIQLLDHNPDNQLAFEYLMTLYCLTRQVHKVAEWLPYTKRFDYPVTPPLYQEAAVVHFVAQKQIVNTKRIPIVPETLERYARFMKLHAAFQKSKQKALLGQLIKEFGSSYFFYFAFGQVGIM